MVAPSRPERGQVPSLVNINIKVASKLISMICFVTFTCQNRLYGLLSSWGNAGLFVTQHELASVGCLEDRTQFINR